MDDAGVYHSVNSVELYLPWNNTWVFLPQLPQFTNGDGSVISMTDTHIMSLDLINGAFSLYLIGGSHLDYNTDVETVSDRVWRLVFNTTNHGYYWYHDTHLPDMGKLGLHTSFL